MKHRLHIQLRVEIALDQKKFRRNRAAYLKLAEEIKDHIENLLFLSHWSRTGDLTAFAVNMTTPRRQPAEKAGV